MGRWDNSDKPDFVITTKAKQMVVAFGIASFLLGFSVGVLAAAESMMR